MQMEDLADFLDGFLGWCHLPASRGSTIGGVVRRIT